MSSIKKLSALCVLSASACTDAPRECGGQTLAGLRIQAAGKYEVVYTDQLPRGTLGRTEKLDKDGPAIVFVASDVNRITRDGAESHELACHVLHNVPHPVKPPKSNHTTPDRSGLDYWDRLRLGMPQ